MKICFYAGDKTWGGLACNGGSKTILRSAEALRLLGHEVDVVASVDKFTYFKHPKPLKKIPKCDVCIAVSPSDIMSMVKECPRGVKMSTWLRGWPVWAMKSEKIVFLLRSFCDAGNKVFVISKWLQRKCEKNGIKAEIQYAGFDDVWAYGDLARITNQIGTLYHKFHKTKNYAFWQKVRERLGNTFSFVEIGRKPMNDEQLRKVYQSCGIWFSATSLEGFHQVPMEAALCGSAIVCNDHARNGIDYANHSTATIYKFNDVEDAVEKIHSVGFTKTYAMEEYIYEHIGTRSKNMKQFAEAL